MQTLAVVLTDFPLLKSSPVSRRSAVGSMCSVSLSKSSTLEIHNASETLIIYKWENAQEKARAKVVLHGV